MKHNWKTKEIQEKVLKNNSPSKLDGNFAILKRITTINSKV
jgi:hypothetical protein